MQLYIHETIQAKLEYFHKVHKIPNIIFHGPSGSGKRTLVNNFISTIYENNKDKIKTFVMHVNCAHGKGIKFIRDELKFFAKTQINSNGGDIFKSIVLLNADKLTMDAQSALRRCIELFSHTTRFFIIVEDKYKLLKPILSRFCEIYVPEPTLKGTPINLYKYNLAEVFKLQDQKTQRIEWLKKELHKMMPSSATTTKPIQTPTTTTPTTTTPTTTIPISSLQLIEFSEKLYEKGYSGLDIINLLENDKCFAVLKDEKRYELLITFNKVRKEFRNEKLLIFFILNFLFLSLDYSLENISFM